MSVGRRIMGGLSWETMCIGRWRWVKWFIQATTLKLLNNLYHARRWMWRLYVNRLWLQQQIDALHWYTKLNLSGRRSRRYSTTSPSAGLSTTHPEYWTMGYPRYVTFTVNIYSELIKTQSFFLDLQRTTSKGSCSATGTLSPKPRLSLSSTCWRTICASS